MTGWGALRQNGDATEYRVHYFIDDRAACGSTQPRLRRWLPSDPKPCIRCTRKLRGESIHPTMPEFLIPGSDRACMSNALPAPWAPSTYSRGATLDACGGDLLYEAEVLGSNPDLFEPPLPSFHLVLVPEKEEHTIESKERKLRPASKLRLARITAGWRLGDLAAAVGINKSTLYRLEMGQIAHPSEPKQQALSSLLGVSSAKLFP
jgi:DNA-binding XRE family transcriptional regulator